MRARPTATRPSATKLSAAQRRKLANRQAALRRANYLYLRGQIRELQIRLTWAGVYSGPTDGVLRAPVALALRRVQVKFGMARYGALHPAALAQLRSVTRRGDGIDPRCRVWGRSICVDKRLRVARALQNGRPVLQAEAQLGRAGLPTREGVFRVFLKSRYHRSHGSRAWSSYMPYALFFNRGQAVHWSPIFASRGYPDVGSHGCVRLRDIAMAQRIFDWTPLGARVVVYRSRP